MNVIDVLVQPKVTHQQKQKQKIDASVLGELLRSFDNSTHALQKQQCDILQGETKTFDGNDLWYLPGVTPERLARSRHGPHKPHGRVRCFRCCWCRTDETFSESFLRCYWSLEHSALRSFMDSHNI